MLLIFLKGDNDMKKLRVSEFEYKKIRRDVEDLVRVKKEIDGFDLSDCSFKEKFEANVLNVKMTIVIGIASFIVDHMEVVKA